MMLEWMLRAALVSVLVGAAALLVDEAMRVLRRPRRWVWLGAMAASVTVPWMGPGVGRWEVGRWAGDGVRRLFGAIGVGGGDGMSRGPGAEMTAMTEGAAGASAAPDAGLAWAVQALEATLPWLWLVASLTMMGGLAWAAFRLRAARARWTPAEVDGQPVLVTERAGPAVVGVLRPAAVLPRWVVGGEAEARRLIVRHEAEHLAVGDTRLLALSALLLAAMPWNLPLWWQQARLRAAIETDCDARVLAGGADPRRYGRILLDVAARGPTVPVLALHVARRRPRLERRLRALVERPAGRLRGARAALLGAFALLVIVVACDVARPLPMEAGEGETDAAGTAGAEVEPSFTLRANRLTFERGETEPTIGDGAGPLIFIDGERVQGGLDQLDPTGIERVEVVKGEAARRVFGTDASAGVIQIFTKTGEGPSR